MDRLLLRCLEKKIAARSLNAFFSLCSYSWGFVIKESSTSEKILTYCSSQRQHIPISKTCGMIEEESVYKLSCCSWMFEFSSAGADACSLSRGENEKETASALESVVYSLKGHVWSKSDVTRGITPYLCVESSGDLRWTAFLQWAGFLVNLRRDEARNLLRRCSWTFTPVCQRTTLLGRTIPSNPPGRRKKD